MNAIVYDLEIKRCIPDGKDVGINPKTMMPYECCQGWEDHKGMGIACVGVWDCLENMPLIFDETNLDDLQNLIAQRQLIIGFNTLGFDNKVLFANGIEIPAWKSFDIFAEVLKVEEIEKSDGGRNVNDFARANFGAAKSAHGSEAPKMYQRGELAALYSYCLRDVMLERRLWLRAHAGNLIHPKTHQVIELPIPETMKTAAKVAG